MAHGTIKTEIQGVWGSSFHYEIVTEYHVSERDVLEWVHKVYSITGDGQKTEQPIPEFSQQDFFQEDEQYNFRKMPSKQTKNHMNAQHARIVRYYLG